MHLRFTIEKGPNKGDAFEVTLNSQPVIIGRKETADFIITGSLTSKEHCKVYADTKSKIIWLKDLNSTNGTYMNGEKIDEVVVHPGDKIQIGEALLSIEDASAVKYTSDLSGKILGGYRIDEKIGQGAMGTVYRANQLSLGREVALKVLEYNLSKDDSFVKSFLDEARSAGKLNHPNVVQVHDVGEADGYYFFSMEYISGGSLSEILLTKGRFSLEEVMKILIDITKALEFAEQHRIIHCDIKPDNIMLSSVGTAKLADLGIAKQLKGNKFSQEGKVFGSPHYVAPEQAKGEAIDHRVDIYALGITAYELFSGKLPFSGKSSNEIIKKHIYEKPKPLKDLVSNMTDEIWNVVVKMTEKRPEDRYESASELSKDLEKALKHLKEGGSDSSSSKRAARPVARRRRRRRRR